MTEHAHPQGDREQTLWGGYMDASARPRASANSTRVAAVIAADGSGYDPAARARQLCGHHRTCPPDGAGTSARLHVA